MTRPASTIAQRLDCALARMRAAKMEPRAIYLTPADYKLAARAATRIWREPGATGFAWPLEHDGVPFIDESLIPKMVPVRESTGKRQSTIYSTHGVAQAVPRHG